MSFTSYGPNKSPNKGSKNSSDPHSGSYGNMSASFQKGENDLSNSFLPNESMISSKNGQDNPKKKRRMSINNMFRKQKSQKGKKESIPKPNVF